MFVDASAIVAILNGEPDADAFADAIEASGGGAVTSPIAVYARYGKERGHRARLNLGNCFADAVARNHGIPLLFKGDDFTKTDIDPAA